MSRREQLGDARPRRAQLQLAQRHQAMSGATSSRRSR
jgi:hypothetical protein